EIVDFAVSNGAAEVLTWLWSSVTGTEMGDMVWCGIRRSIFRVIAPDYSLKRHNFYSSNPDKRDCDKFSLNHYKYILARWVLENDPTDIEEIGSAIAKILSEPMSNEAAALLAECEVGKREDRPISWEN